MLTERQHKLLTYIAAYIEAKGVSPSFEEMKRHMGLVSRSNIHELVTKLEARGFIRRHPKFARSIEIVRLPESASPELLRCVPTSALLNELAIRGVIAPEVRA